MQKKPEQALWWQKGSIYQIYPRSFKDANQDGIGDLRGIIQKIDYLQWLGVDAIWISPIFPSPMNDFGYDISDYRGIEPLFGNMQDFDEMLQLIHEKDMKLILDLVPNHCSDQHPWFQESRSSKDNPRRDWYIWKDPAPDGGEPNNWQSVFGGSAWEYDEKTGQYYYHAFLKEQPDLNWRNPEVRKAMLEVIRFWLEKGVDGFRVDVIWHMIKDELFRDNPPNPNYKEGQSDINRFLNTYSEDQPMVHDVIAEMRQMIDEFPERLLIGEIYLPLNKLVTYYGKEGAGVHLPFNFQLIESAWSPENIYALVNEYEGSLAPGNWPNWVLGNHDKSRIQSRVGEKQARLAALLLLSLRGTPTLYYGDEIGMHDVPIPPERIQDPADFKTPGSSRDPQRTPMQWNNEAYAGFSEAEPWLPLANDFKERNVEKEKNDPASMLSLYRSLLELRKNTPALQVGDYFPLGLLGQLMVFKRVLAEQEVLIAINFGEEKISYQPEAHLKGKILLSSSRRMENHEVSGSIELQGEEAVIVSLS